jgi:Na+/H+ antiporter NhaC
MFVQLTELAAVLMMVASFFMKWIVQALVAQFLNVIHASPLKPHAKATSTVTAS